MYYRNLILYRFLIPSVYFVVVCPHTKYLHNGGKTPACPQSIHCKILEPGLRPNDPAVGLFIPLQNLINCIFCESLVTREFRATKEPINWPMSEQLLRPWGLILSLLYPIATLKPRSGMVTLAVPH